MADITQQENIATTVAREARKPFSITDRSIAVPDGWSIRDTENMQPTPYRKKATVSLADDAGFVDYLKRHGSLASCTIWCDANYQKGQVDFTAIVNDHTEAADGQQWRDHLATFTPIKSVEWQRWNESHGKQMSQFDFATFIETNLADIASAEGYPTGTDMLQMATALEITQDMRIKSAIRVQSGGVRVEYVEDADAETAKSMQVFEKFALGLPVFWGGSPYKVQARLRYRLKQGVLTFWYELIRQDKVLEDAARTLTTSIKEATGFPLFHGKPFAK